MERRKGVQTGSGTAVLSWSYLRRHIHEGPAWRDAGFRAGSDRASESETREFHAVRRVEQDVLGPNVPMAEVVSVDGREGRRRLLEHRSSEGLREGANGEEERAEVVAGEFEDQHGHSLGLAGGVHGGG